MCGFAAERTRSTHQMLGYGMITMAVLAENEEKPHARKEQKLRCAVLCYAVNNGDPPRVAVEKQTRSWRCFPGAGEHSMFGEIAKSRTDQHSRSQLKARVGAV